MIQYQHEEIFYDKKKNKKQMNFFDKKKKNFSILMLNTPVV